MSRVPYWGRTDLFAGLNGAIAGLVSITAGPDITQHLWAVIIGAIGGIICTLALRLLEKVKLDDVVGAIPAHLFAGVWGTLAVAIAAGGDIVTQLIGILAIGAFVFITSLILWKILERLPSVCGFRLRSSVWVKTPQSWGWKRIPSSS